MSEWHEISGEDAIEAWPEHFDKDDPDAFPPGTRAFVRRLDNGGQQLRIEYAAGGSGSVYDLTGDESPDELYDLTLRRIFGDDDPPPL